MRYGIIGAGMMGVEHMLNLRLVAGAEVVAVADPFPRSQKWAADTAPEAAIFSDPARMLDSVELDAVVVATPNHTHADVMDSIWGRELHVLLEKPMCTTVEDCRRVEAAAVRHPGIVWVGMEYRYMPPVTRLVSELRDGTIGSLKMLAIREHRFPFLPKVDDWNRFARNTGGTLVEKCCHFFDLMRFIIGSEPVRVYASGAQDVNHLDERYDGETPDILDNAYVIVDFEGGVRAHLDLCMFAEASRNQEEICAVGDAGKLEAFVPESTLFIGQRSPFKAERRETIAIPVDSKLIAAGGHHGSTYFEHEGFARAMREGLAPAVSVHDGLMAVAIGAAAERSIQESRAVRLSEYGL